MAVSQWDEKLLMNKVLSAHIMGHMPYFLAYSNHTVQ